MESIRIIEFRPEYTEAVKSLARLAMQDVGIDPSTIDLYMENDLENIADIYKDRQRFWLALNGDRLVGTAAITEMDQTTARLRRMFVSPGLQGRGVGQQLCDAALNFASKEGYERVILDTDRLMDKAHRFYEKNGFRKAGEDQTRLFYERTLGQESAGSFPSS